MPTPPPSSPESSHVLTVFSQGPPSQNTRSSVMNRTLPNTTPPASYRVALMHIQQREEEEVRSRSLDPSTSPSPFHVSTPSPSPTPGLDSFPHSPSGSILSTTVHPTPHRPNLKEPPSASSSPGSRHSSSILPLSRRLAHSPPSAASAFHHPPLSTSSLLSSPKPPSVTTSTKRYHLMQEHMDNMHSDIASLGHKHDHAMTEIGDIRDNIGYLDLNIDRMKNLIIGLGNKFDNVLPSTAVPPDPSRLPTDMPKGRSSATPFVSRAPRPPSMPLSGPFPPVPNRVSSHGQQNTMSQTSSFTSYPPIQHHHDQSRAFIPTITTPNSVSGVPNAALDSDLSLASETDPKPNVTFDPQSNQIADENALRSGTRTPSGHDSTFFPSTQVPSTHRNSQNNTPVINNSAVQSTQSPVLPSQFNSNYFLLLLDEIPKLSIVLLNHHFLNVSLTTILTSHYKNCTKVSSVR